MTFNLAFLATAAAALADSAAGLHSGAADRTGWLAAGLAEALVGAGAVITTAFAW